MSAQHTLERKPISVSAVDQAFGGKVREILPLMSEIPEEFGRLNKSLGALAARLVLQRFDSLPSAEGRH